MIDNEKNATVDWRLGRVFVATGHVSIEGFRMEGEPYFVHDDPTDFGGIADLLRQALAASTFKVLPRPPRELRGSKLPELAGVKTYSTFMKGTKSVWVEMIDDQIRLTPMRNAGAKGGFQFKTDDVIAVSDVGELAACLERALDLAD